MSTPRHTPAHDPPGGRRTTIWLDDDLRDGLEQDAAAYGRNISQSIRWHLRRSLDLEKVA